MGYVSDIAYNLEVVRKKITRATERSGRAADAVTLIAVTKTVSAERILEVIQAGVTHLGENRVQEAAIKLAGRDGAGNGKVPRESITLHMIGSLQRNKVRAAVALFDCVHSVDRVELVLDLAKAAALVRSDKPLPVLLEVNLTGEINKAGVPPQDLPRLADALAECSTYLQGTGLMTIARLGAGEAELRRTFSSLRRHLEELRRSHPGDWTHLSMGMSDDFECAIEEGATMVRLGRAIFGERTA